MRCPDYSETSNKGHSERGQTSQAKILTILQKITSERGKLPVKEDHLSTEDKTAGPEGVLY